ncbi:hypothetical protein ACLOJK_003365 [Asimina triloba]
MPQLRIPDLSNTDIRSLPASLSLLINLRALICHGCGFLKQIPPLGKLKDLELVDLSDCDVEKWPDGIADLSKLRQLAVDFGNERRIMGRMDGTREWWKGIEWEDDHSKSIYSNLYVGGIRIF